MGSQRSSKEGRRRGSTELGSERGSKESREGGPKGSKEFSRRSSKEPSVAELERRGSTDTARGSAGSEGRGSDPGPLVLGVIFQHFPSLFQWTSLPKLAIPLLAGGSRRNSAQSAHSYTLGPQCRKLYICSKSSVFRPFRLFSWQKSAIGYEFEPSLSLLSTRQAPIWTLPSPSVGI